MDSMNELIGMIKNFDPNKQDEKYFLLEKAKEVRTKVELMENELERSKSTISNNASVTWARDHRNK